jgi:acyl-homoserine lactone acylase PvdQ
VRRGGIVRASIAASLVAFLVLVPAAAAQLPALPGQPGGGGPESFIQEYGTNDGGGFWNVLPPGQNGHASGPDIAAFLAACPPPQTNCPNAPKPPHFADQLSMYADLVHASPGLRAEDIGKYYKDATFGVRQDDVERTYSPREDVTVRRDKGFGVPHIYAGTRAGAMFGLGYVGAEDRLFVMDALRNAGKAQLSSFAGGARGNREMDRSQWKIAPYTEADLQRQYDLGDEVYGAAGRALQEDVDNYVAGINKYIEEARTNPLKMPGEYAAIGRPQGPEEWKNIDVIATASLVGGIFGKGGGEELEAAQLLRDTRQRFGRRRGKRVWNDLRTAEDPEAPVTVNPRRRFPYRLEPRRLRRGSTALPDRGTLKDSKVVASASGASSGADGLGLGGLLRSAGSASNALLVSGRESSSGRPLAVMGPQTAYFAPQLLMEIDVHAPGIDARGATFAGVSLYVLLGRGRDYAWSATSAGQDIIDTFAVPLCEPGGGRPTMDSTHYRHRGQCRAMEVLERTNSWTPTPADQTPPGSETLKTERTALGLVVARAMVRGRPVAYTKLRSTYFHEADSALGFVDLNNPNAIKGPRDFQRAVSKIGFTFNWFYADHRNIAYFNSGNNPVRSRGVSTHLPVHGRYAWRGHNPDLNIANYTRFAAHPQAINQSFFSNWNNKQARGYRAADDNFAYGSVYRSDSLTQRIRRGIRGSRKMSLAQLVDAMEDAGTVDLRATRVLPYALRVLGRPRNPGLRDALAKLRAWYRSGGHRLDRDRNGVYEHTDAIRILDAWWPRWLDAQFKPTLGEAVFNRLKGILRQDDDPNLDGSHLGSAYNGGWYHYAEKDLRRLLGRRRLRGLRGPPSRRARMSRVYCGGGRRKGGRRPACRRRLAASLAAALRVDPAKLYEDEVCEDYGRPGDQWCFDAVRQRPVGAVNHPLIHWINRPTFQQALEIQRQAPR